MRYWKNLDANKIDSILNFECAQADYLYQTKEVHESAIFGHCALVF